MGRLTAERRAELERKVYEVDGAALRETLARYVLAGLAAGLISRLAAIVPWLLAVRPGARYVAREWRLGVLLADSREAERELERLPDRDLRSLGR